jgi:hypothetical protein
MTTLVSPDLTTVFTVPEADWSAISKRVGVSIALHQAFEGPQMMPSFPSLLAASRTWRATTFPSLVTQSGSLGGYADTAIGDFTSLQQNIDALGPAATVVPESLKTTVRDTLRRLHAATSTQADGFTALVPPIDAFRVASDAMDRDVAQTSIAQTFPPTSAQTSTVADGIAHVEGRWTALRDDLAASTGDIDVTMPFLAGLGIAAAIVSWQRIKSEAAEFASMAAGQQEYLSGSLIWTLHPGEAELVNQT